VEDKHAVSFDGKKCSVTCGTFSVKKLVYGLVNEVVLRCQRTVRGRSGAAALQPLDPQDAYETIRDSQISTCGVLPAVIVLKTLREMGRLKNRTRIEFGTSADVTGDKTHVVGQAGMPFG
jgi:hypothetical protein